MRMLYFSFLSLLISNISLGQDSTYYSVLWTPTYVYRAAKISEEDVFAFQTLGKSSNDSVLIQRTFYNTLGRIVKQENYLSSELSSRIQNFYSDKLDSSFEEGFSANRIVHTYYQHDKKGNLSTKKEVITPGDDVGWRYGYNDANQLVALYKQVGNRSEYLAASYTYLSNHLVEKIRYYDTAGKEYFTYLYKYKGQKEFVTTVFAQGPHYSPIVERVRTYNKEGQLLKRETETDQLGPNPFGGFQMTKGQIEEDFYYLPNGLLKEKTTKKDGETVRVERHVYR